MCAILKNNNDTTNNKTNDSGGRGKRGRFIPFSFIMIYFLILLIAIFVGGRDISSSSSSVSSLLDTTTASSMMSTTREERLTEVKKLERGKYLGPTVSGTNLYEAYKEIQEEYRSKAFNNDADWKVVKSNDGIEVSLLRHPDDADCPYLRISAILYGANPQDCWDYLRLENWGISMPQIDPFYEGVSLHGNYYHPNVDVMTVARKRMKRLLAFGKRDFVFVSVSEKPKKDDTTTNGTTTMLTSGTVSVITPVVPREKGYTRAFQDSIAFYRHPSEEEMNLQNNNNNTKDQKMTHLTIVCRMDLNDSGDDGEGGSIPMWLYVRTIGLTAYQSIVNLRHYLGLHMQEVDERAKATGTTQEDIINDPIINKDDNNNDIDNNSQKKCEEKKERLLLFEKVVFQEK